MKILFRCIMVFVLLGFISGQAYSYEPNPVPSFYTNEEFIDVAQMYVRVSENVEQTDSKEILKACVFKGYVRGIMEGFGDSKVEGIPEHISKLSSIYRFETIVYNVAKAISETEMKTSLLPRELIFASLISITVE